MSSRIINKTIAREIAVPTVLALVTFTFVLLMGRMLKLMELIINKGVPLLEIIELFVYLLPSFLVITIPLSFLLGVMLGFGRLSSDSEIVALKASGISLYGLSRPVFTLALAACLLTGLLTVFAVPAGNRAFRQQIFEMASTRASVGIQERVFNDEFDNLVLYADHTDERQGTFSGILISDERTSDTPALVLAREGRIISDQDNLTLTLRLEDGAIHRLLPGKDAYQIIKFNNYDVSLNMGQQLDNAPKRRTRPADMDLADLRDALDDGITTEQRARELHTEFHKRLTFPIAPLIFALIGVPLGIQSHRSGRGGGFSLALLVFLGYYLSLSLAETLVIETGFSVIAGLWLPNLLFLIGGALLLHQTSKERRFAFFDWIIDAPRRVLKSLAGHKGAS